MEVPADWRAALAAVQTIHPEAMLAGGCLRDLDNDRVVKDIDIFVSGTKSTELNTLAEELRDVDGFVAVADVDPSALYPVGDGNDVVGYIECWFREIGIPVQVIMVDFDCSRITERFDFGICCMAFDGEALTITGDYANDKRDQVFRLCRPRDGLQLAASVHRYARLIRKYEGWRFVAFEDEDSFSCDFA